VLCFILLLQATPEKIYSRTRSYRARGRLQPWGMTYRRQAAAGTGSARLSHPGTMSTVPKGPMGGEAKAVDGSTTGSGGMPNYAAEKEAAQWQVERDDTKALHEQLKQGDAAAAKTQKAIDKEDADYKPS